MPIPRAKRSAFTLYELIIVIIILGIMAAVTVPTLSTASDGSQALAAVRIVAADMEYAQSVAVTYRKAVKITFDVAHDAYKVEDSGGVMTHPVSRSPFDVSLKDSGGTDRASLLSAKFGSGNAANVSFDETGAPDNGGVVKLLCGDSSYTITLVGATGRVKVSQP